MTDKRRIEVAVEIALVYGQVDGGHHKIWVIDQMLRMLLGEEAYEKAIKEYEEVYMYTWDQGVAP